MKLLELFKWKKKQKVEAEKNEIKDLFEEIEGKLDNSKSAPIQEKQEEISSVEEVSKLIEEINEKEVIKVEDKEENQEIEKLEEDEYKEEAHEGEDEVRVAKEFSPENVISEEERTYRKIKNKIEEPEVEPVTSIVGHIVSKTAFREVNKSTYISRNTTHITKQIATDLIQIFKEQDLQLIPDHIQNKVHFFNDEMNSQIIIPIPQLDIPGYQMLIYQVKKMVKEKTPDNKLYSYTIGRRISSNELVIKVSKKIIAREEV